MITPYVNLRDLGETEKKVTAAGGKIHKSKQEVPGMGWFTLCSDPDGTIFGCWQPLQAAANQPARKKATARKVAAKKSATKKVAKKAAKQAAKATKKVAAKRARKR